jgi:hypothetical protein
MRRASLLVSVAVSVGCSSVGVGDELAAIALLDVNPNSASYNEVVTAEQFEGMVSLWYFGHAT